jgi:hypothetical protein
MKGIRQGIEVRMIHLEQLKLEQMLVLMLMLVPMLQQEPMQLQALMEQQE